MDKKTITFLCTDCGESTSLLIKTSQLTKAGRYRGYNLCLACDRIRQKTIRGNNAEEMKELSLRRMPPVKIFSRAEVEAVAHEVAVPVSKKQHRNYFRVEND